MGSVAVLSMHTSPLVQPGTGDSGGMNVYVRELGGSLARAGVPVTIYVRRFAADLPERVALEPGLDVVHVDAGPLDLPKESLIDHVEEFASGVQGHVVGSDVDVLHANYWLSAVAGHRIKHELSLPLVSTFHTLARVKAEAGDDDAPCAHGWSPRPSDAVMPSAPPTRSRWPSSWITTALIRRGSSSCRPASTTPSSHRAIVPVPGPRWDSTTSRPCCSWDVSNRSRV
ncbi:MAG: glycosyltransferase [Microthrixaceae bacterium]